MRDIETRTDIDLMMRVFYERAFLDDKIGYIFTDVAALDIETHLPVIGDFWESLLFGTKSYQKRGRNPLVIHKALDSREKLVKEHFVRWLYIFERTVDDEFAGERAELIKARARAIAGRMQVFIAGDGSAISDPRIDARARQRQ
ncbi:MAG: group III truncated hemoglobin [Pyrinomonadaceae bacterium]